MSRKRKTLKQKKLRDLHQSPTPHSTHEAQHQKVEYSYSAPTQIKATVSRSTSFIPTFEHTVHDLKQSLIVSAILVIINIVVHMLVENNIISLKIIGL